MRMPIAALALGLAWPVATASAAPAGALPVSLADAAALGHGGFVWQDAGGPGALAIVVSIADQRAYVYRGRTLVAASTVSTGRQGRDTPTGSFPILQKAAMHRSSLYDDAPMPYMQRLTWDGVAIHAGANPGFPASHGCVRVPTGFARKLFTATRIGTNVTVVDTSVDGAPVDLSPPPPEPVPDTTDETAAANRAQIAALP